MLGISWDQISGVVQRLLMFGGGIAVGKGWISNELMIQIVGAIISIGGVLWGVKSNTSTALVQSVEALPETSRVIMKATEQGQKVAAATGPKVEVAGQGARP